MCKQSVFEYAMEMLRDRGFKARRTTRGDIEVKRGSRHVGDFAIFTGGVVEVDSIGQGVDSKTRIASRVIDLLDYARRMHDAIEKLEWAVRAFTQQPNGEDAYRTVTDHMVAVRDVRFNYYEGRLDKADAITEEWYEVR